MLRKWLTYTVCGIPWTAFVADERGCPDFVDTQIEALTDRDRCRIYVRASLVAGSRERAEEALAHEIEHSINASSGATSSLFGSSDRREERSILTLNGPRFAAYKSAGILRIPRPPVTARR